MGKRSLKLKAEGELIRRTQKVAPVAFPDKGARNAC